MDLRPLCEETQQHVLLVLLSSSWRGRRVVVVIPGPLMTAAYFGAPLPRVKKWTVE